MNFLKTVLAISLLIGVSVPSTALAQQSVTMEKETGRVDMPEAHVIGTGPREPRFVVLGMEENFGDESWSEVERWTSAELKGLGLEVINAPAKAKTAETRLIELGLLAERHNAIGAVRIVRRAGKQVVRLWIHDAVTNKMVFHEIETADRSARAAALTAMRVVELLNASFLEIRMRKRSKPIRAVPPIVKKLVALSLDPPPQGSDWFVGAGVIAKTAVGAGTMGAVAIFAGVRPLDWLAVVAELDATLFSTLLEGAGAESNISLYGGRAMVIVEPWPMLRLSPAMGAGFGFVALRSSGKDNTAFTGNTDWASASIVSVRPQLGWRVSPKLQLVLAANIGFTIPELGVDLASANGIERKSLGRPIIDTLVGISYNADF